MSWSRCNVEQKLLLETRVTLPLSRYNRNEMWTASSSLFGHLHVVDDADDDGGPVACSIIKARKRGEVRQRELTYCRKVAQGRRYPNRRSPRPWLLFPSMQYRQSQSHASTVATHLPLGPAHRRSIRIRYSIQVSMVYLDLSWPSLSFGPGEYFPPPSSLSPVLPIKTTGATQHSRPFALYVKSFLPAMILYTKQWKKVLRKINETDVEKLNVLDFIPIVVVIESDHQDQEINDGYVLWMMIYVYSPVRSYYYIFFSTRAQKVPFVPVKCSESSDF